MQLPVASGSQGEYREYLRHQSLQVIAEIAAIKGTATDEDGGAGEGHGGGGAAAGNAGGSAGSTVRPDLQGVLDSFVPLTHTFVQAVKRLQQAHAAKSKSEYLPIVDEGLVAVTAINKAVRPVAGHNGRAHVASSALTW